MAELNHKVQSPAGAAVATIAADRTVIRLKDALSMRDLELYLRQPSRGLAAAAWLKADCSRADPWR